MSARGCCWGVLASAVVMVMTVSKLDLHAMREIDATVGPLDGRPNSESLYQLASNWTDDHGASVKLESLRGHVQVVAMMFTRCPSLCPTLVHDLKAMDATLRSHARDGIRYVLVTIDPEHDTPVALRQFRDRMDLKGDRW